MGLRNGIDRLVQAEGFELNPFSRNLPMVAIKLRLFPLAQLASGYAHGRLRSHCQCTVVNEIRFDRS